MNKSEILLESGTGEVELLHFKVAGESYAINVVKVKGIINIDNISKVPNSHPAIAGVSLIRGEVISIVDMNQVINGRQTKNVKESMNLLCEFNQLKVAFAIDEVLGISRVYWNQISKPDDITANSLVIGNVNIDEELLMLLDFEKIIMDISPKTGIHSSRLEEVEDKDRSAYKIVLADDSPMIRSVLEETLRSAGFVDLKFFNDGQEAYDYIKARIDARGKEFVEDVNLLITDIEMPNLDGHTLTRKLKEDKYGRRLPIIIFSSLITEDLYHKGQSVGADAQMSKPEIGRLIRLIDKTLEI